MRNAVVVIVAAALIFLPAVIPVSAAPAPTANPLVRVRAGSLLSTNWSGYAVNGTAGSVSLVLGSWTIPSVTCPSSGNLYSSAWVGIDGFQSSTVEQVGTDSDCHSGAASYYAWYEFYPNPSITISGFAVHPGDVVAALVVFRNGAFTVAIRDMTTGQTFSTSSTVSGAQRSSAEIIVEAPAICGLSCKITSLADFGTVGFGIGNTNARYTCGATINGVSGSIGSFGSSVQQITMVSGSNPSQVKAQPSALTNSGTSFTVQWLSSGP